MVENGQDDGQILTYFARFDATKRDTRIRCYAKLFVILSTIISLNIEYIVVQFVRFDVRIEDCTILCAINIGRMNACLTFRWEIEIIQVPSERSVSRQMCIVSFVRLKLCMDGGRKCHKHVTHPMLRCDSKSFS